MNLAKLFFFFLILISCLPEQEIRTPLDNDQAATPTIPETDNTQDSEQNNDTPNIAWLNSAQQSSVLSLNLDNKKSVSLFGKKIEDYLSQTDNFQSTYCLEVRFTQSSIQKPKRLRVKLTPQKTFQKILSQFNRVFHVNLSSNLGNDFCYKNSLETVQGKKLIIDYRDSNYDQIPAANTPNSSPNQLDIGVASNTSQVCSNCTSFINSQEIILYRYDQNDNLLKRVESLALRESQLALRIDTNSQSDQGQSSCTNSECIAKGFSCCQNGQCIKEKSIKISGKIADELGFLKAEKEKYNNPNWYKNYEQFYYSCLERVPGSEDVSEDPPPSTNPNNQSEEEFLRLKKDYECLLELEEKSLSKPFHKSPINSSETYSKCEINNINDESYYKTIMKRLYLDCGCSEKSDLNIMIQNCPAYTYTPIYETTSTGETTTKISQLLCKELPKNQQTIPFQDQNVQVHSRSAPHRFFTKDNREIHTNQSSDSNAIQEGDSFQYLDTGFLFPRNNDFNMNSILGQMTVKLDQARPAHKIDVDFDKRYFISTRSGLFRPCPSCAKDSWLENFMAHPFSQGGVGIQAVGHTTQRDQFNNNTTLGNYADTKFSRACYVPPTMLAFSHRDFANTQDQRLTRLKTQAALFMNGFQRDWYGFNKGALIGSFDGVTWFAIGKGRIVTSTSKKLFLAINAPFADLSSPTDHIVTVKEHDFVSSGATLDYDPSLNINHPNQNEAASCQEYHECQTDAHCISKLGWEYSCVDVSDIKTNWPKFDPLTANEIAQKHKTSSIANFLQQGGLAPGSSTKKCIYRGAGAPCRQDYEKITDQNKRKSLACAPNFYCAALDATNAFNKEISRFAKPLDELIESKNHLYGMDANILGRPKNYLSTGNLYALPADVKESLEQNLRLQDPNGANRFGLCRPGKRLPSKTLNGTTINWEPSKQHHTFDPSYRTDFISQIASCNASLYNQYRYSSCPIIGKDGNYAHLQDNFLNNSVYFEDLVPPVNLSKEQTTQRLSFAQNSCGLESLDIGTVLGHNNEEQFAKTSAFNTIEAAPLSSSQVIISKTLARNACLRKAGAVCHTDLDCSPNKLHAQVIESETVPLSFFGNLAEKKYYEESLICGQAQSPPQFNDEDYHDYNIHHNRCCRPVGQNLTMYTENSPMAEESKNIDSSLYGSLNPASEKRYSRYSVVETSIDSVTKKANIIRVSADTQDLDNDKNLDNAVNITNKEQWKTIHNAASKTCCGGSWVRKFFDGSNNWALNRFNFDPQNFQCLNYRSALALTENATAYNMTQSFLENNRINFCSDASQTRGGCIQHNIPRVSSFNETPEKPQLNTDPTQMRLRSHQTNMNSLWSSNTWSFAQFLGSFQYQVDARGYVLPWSDDDPAQVNRKNLITEVPAFITFDDISELNISLSDPVNNSNIIQCVPATVVSNDQIEGLTREEDSWVAGACPDTAGNNCCYVYNNTTRMLRVAFSNADKVLASNYNASDSELLVEWTPVGTLGWEQKKNPGNLPVTNSTLFDHRRSSIPGNDLYYLKKLAKLELIGIPQITYEPIYCNDNYQKLMPGIINDSNIKTAIDYYQSSKTFIDPNASSPWKTDTAAPPFNANALNLKLVSSQELIDHDQIFSDNQFKCCRELGSKIKNNESQDLCCSGFAVDDSEGGQTKICKLPPRTDLNIYFNKFISGEGLKNNLGVSPLTEKDFEETDGSPIISDAILIKLREIGKQVCSSGKVRSGGAFGNFQARPIGTRGSQAATLYSIVDDRFDQDTNSDPSAGISDFENGFRWNHHVYCDDEE